MSHAQKPDFVFRRNGRDHLNRRGASVQSTTGSRRVRISGSNAGYTMFRGSVKGTDYTLHSPVSPSLPLPCVHRVPSHFNWNLPLGWSEKVLQLDHAVHLHVLYDSLNIWPLVSYTAFRSRCFSTESNLYIYIYKCKVIPLQARCGSEGG